MAKDRIQILFDGQLPEGTEPQRPPRSFGPDNPAPLTSAARPSAPSGSSGDGSQPRAVPEEQDARRRERICRQANREQGEIERPGRSRLIYKRDASAPDFSRKANIHWSQHHGH
eukprot:231797-Pyramimonas_sp.AAC.2